MKIVITLFLITIAFVSFSKTKLDTITINEDIQLIPVAEGFYIHKSFTTASFGRFSSNGVLLIKNGKALMIDTPFTIEETSCIYNYLKDSMNISVERFIGGHYHEDCIGGMVFLKEMNVKTILNEKTKEKCLELNLPLPDETFTEKYELEFEDVPFECRFFGGGHSIDNIVVYFPEQNILFGGCLIKSANAINMGNTADAVPLEWATTVQRVLNAYPDTEVVIPGHGDYGDVGLLSFTIDLAKKSFGR